MSVNTNIRMFVVYLAYVERAHLFKPSVPQQREDYSQRVTGKDCCGKRLLVFLGLGGGESRDCDDEL